jgi:hypothetical protein
VNPDLFEEYYCHAVSDSKRRFFVASSKRLYRKPNFGIEWEKHFLKVNKCCPHLQTKLAMQAYGEPPSIRQSQDFLFSQLARDLNSILISSFERGASSWLSPDVIF